MAADEPSVDRGSLVQPLEQFSSAQVFRPASAGKPTPIEARDHMTDDIRLHAALARSVQRPLAGLIVGSESAARVNGVISTGSPSPHPYLRSAIAATLSHSMWSVSRSRTRAVAPICRSPMRTVTSGLRLMFLTQAAASPVSANR